MGLDIFTSLKWPDVVDVLVISFILHRLVLVLRGTAALQIVLGLLLLWVIQGIATAAGLVLTSWLFQGVGAVAVLIIVVVFRNEIREVFIQTNPIRLFLGRPQETRRIDINLILQAVFQLASTRTGALIVIANRDRLNPYLREGFALDARFNPQIIESIFAKQSPMHDGAIIIRADRIARAGTFLPLTEKEGLPRHYGTRHRAAIGLSEVSDSVVLVVSEERGEVSLVHRGRVEVMHDSQKLKGALGRLLLGVDRKRKRRSWRQLWLANAGGFLATFLLVATVWGIYSGKQLSLISITTPIDFRNIPENLVLMNASTEKVEVQITGRRRLVSGLQPEQVEAFLDLKGITFGVHPLVLNQESIELPLGLEVVRLTPPTVRVEMEQRVEKRVAVTPRLEGSPPAGYEIDKVKVRPESVKVSGALSILQATSSFFTEPIDLATIEPGSGEMTFEVPLVLSSASLRLLAGESKDVRVDVELRSHETDSDDQKEAKIRYHLVRSGDTLWGIGRRYGLTVEELRRLNELKPGAAIYPDQKLSLGPKR
jgi:uncharacterized protein (TIGR00159 family)